jgi:hypothetical protein
MEVRRLCARKEEIYARLIGNHKPPVVPGVPMFLDTLVKHNVSRFSSLQSMQDACPMWLLHINMRYAGCAMPPVRAKARYAPTSGIATSHQRDLMHCVRWSVLHHTWYDFYMAGAGWSGVSCACVMAEASLEAT